METFRLDAAIAGAMNCAVSGPLAQEIDEAYQNFLTMKGYTTGNDELFKEFWDAYNKKDGSNTYCYYTLENKLFNS